MSATAIKNNVLVITSDPEQLGKLQRKLADYQRRYGRQAPEAEPGATYRYYLLGQLLEKKIVDVDQIRDEFMKQEWFQYAAFQEAVAIITAYNTGNLGMIKGGSGLT